MRFKQSNLSKIVIQFRNIAFKITVNSNPRNPNCNRWIGIRADTKKQSILNVKDCFISYFLLLCVYI